uniref:Uncharacterized protein n=1 Tax=Anguilla anguilla TaxID=7936 RepID=A0A0E9UEL6_ANGAN
MCLSVLLWQQRTSPQLPLSLAADCLSKLARRSLLHRDPKTRHPASGDSGTLS